jgi:hypothetical protein
VCSLYLPSQSREKSVIAREHIQKLSVTTAIRKTDAHPFRVHPRFREAACW